MKPVGNPTPLWVLYVTLRIERAVLSKIDEVAFRTEANRG